jgi:hypothetical protein
MRRRVTRSPKRQIDRKIVEMSPATRRRAKNAADLLEDIVLDIPGRGDMNCEAKADELASLRRSVSSRRSTPTHRMETWYSTMFYIDCRRGDILEQAAAQARRFAAGLLEAANRIDTAAKRRRKRIANF